MTPFEAQLLHDRAIDVANMIAETYLRSKYQASQIPTRATERMSVVLRDLARAGAKGLPDEEDLTSAIDTRNASVHEGSFDASAYRQAVRAEKAARQLANAVARHST